MARRQTATLRPLLLVWMVAALSIHCAAGEHVAIDLSTAGRAGAPTPQHHLHPTTVANLHLDRARVAAVLWPDERAEPAALELDIVLRCAEEMAPDGPASSASQASPRSNITVALPTFFDPVSDTHIARLRLTRRGQRCELTAPHPLRLHGRALALALSPRLFLAVENSNVTTTDSLSTFISVGANQQYFAASSSGLFSAAPSPSPSSSSLYYGVGMDLAWPGGANSTQPFYSAAFAQLRAAKANYARIWLGPSYRPDSPFSDLQLQTTLGQLNTTHAANVDWLLQAAEGAGMRLLLALESYNSLCTDTKYFCGWDQSIYNQANGGPLGQAGDFWGSTAAHAAFRQYARAVVARYAHSPAVFAWQLFNEMDGCLGGTTPPAGAWVANITAYIKSIDPYAHLISNSYAEESGVPAFDQLPNISFTTTHAYESGDLGSTLAHYSVIKAAAAKKPTFSGEFGLNKDPRIARIVLHNGMWGTVAALGAMSGACWYWQTVLANPSWLEEFAAVASFVENIPLLDHHWAPLSSTTPPPGSVMLLMQGATSPVRKFGRDRDLETAHQPTSTGWRAESDAAASFVFGYMHNRQAIYGAPSPFPTIAPFTITIPQPCAGSSSGSSAEPVQTNVSLQWYNTTSGAPLGQPSSLQCTGGQISFQTPSFQSDLAFILRIRPFFII